MAKEAESMRDQLEAAFKGADEEVTDEVVEAPESETETEDRARDEKGRFVAKEESEPAPEEVKDETPEVAAAPEVEEPEVKPEAQDALAPPNGWSAEAKAKWHELPSEIQQAVNKREQDVHKGFSERDERASFGKELYQVMQPYMPQIQAEGGTPVTAVQSLLNTAYILRTGSPEQKRDLLLRTANQFGVDLSNISQQEQEDVPAYVQQLNQKIDRFTDQFEQQRQQESLRVQAEVQTEIEAFKSNPAHPYYEQVKSHMAALLRTKGANDLKDAYDKACWADPSIRATLQAQERAREEQKRRQDRTEKAKAAKAKDVSLTEGPGNTAGSAAPGQDRSIRDELEAQMEAQRSAV